MNFYFLIACTLLLLDNQAFSTEMNCKFQNTHGWIYHVGNVYECEIPAEGILIDSPEKKEITSIIGEHKRYKDNSDVESLEANLLYSIHYFPTGLGKFFKNIKAVSLYYCDLKELHQFDLKQFPRLVYFRSIHNKIEVIEQGLFDYNPDLAYVEFTNERSLLHIDPTVFDNLNRLDGMEMALKCVKQEIYNNREKVLEAIKVMKNNCVSSDYLALESEIKQLESESKTLDAEAFKSSLKTFDGKNSNSVFLKYQPLKNAYESLKSVQ